ncbi:DUF5681 domain-containing protein [Tsuneonella sp. SYSU-LHT278]|uniref:DUF5681 domain-containing protein n=1 Tax=Tsuneonella sediminis TaxID=3416089 RepID=UPI003F7A57AF
MSDNHEEQDRPDAQLEEAAPRKPRTLRESAETEARFKRNLDSYIVRDERGRFRPGTPSPNPYGARPKERRMYGMTQTTKDVLELLEQPVMMTKGKGKKKQVPAIVAIYDKMIHKAIAGDWQAMKKCIELRERYSDFREETLKGLLREAGNLRLSFAQAGQKMPEEVERLLEFIELTVAHGQFRPA